MSRELTRDEVQGRFLDHVRTLIQYWDGPSVVDRSQRERLDGLAFSILSALDGSAVNLSSFTVSPRPHEDDKEYYRANGENWFPESGCDIAGDLHYRFSAGLLRPEQSTSP